MFANDRPFYIERHGYPENVYFDISYYPVRDEEGKVPEVERYCCKLKKFRVNAAFLLCPLLVFSPAGVAKRKSLIRPTEEP